MAIETEIVVELARVEVADDYRVELTVHDVDAHTTAVVALTWGQAQQLVAELAEALVEADLALREDHPEAAVHGFDAARADA